MGWTNVSFRMEGGWCQNEQHRVTNRGCQHRQYSVRVTSTAPAPPSQSARDRCSSLELCSQRPRLLPAVFRMQRHVPDSTKQIHMALFRSQSRMPEAQVESLH